MRARELAEFLMRDPERLVQVDVPEGGIWLVDGAAFDQFSAEEGPSVVLTVEEEGLEK